jgi:SPP1 family predicted phage head-tail adaptor
MLDAGRLRHRVSIQARTNIQDPVSGESVVVWNDAWTNVAAAIEPLSASERISAQAQQSEVSARVTIRPLPGLTAQHRIVHNSRIYNIEGVIPDPDSGLEWLTLPVSEGVSDGA